MGSNGNEKAILEAIDRVVGNVDELAKRNDTLDSNQTATFLVYPLISSMGWDTTSISEMTVKSGGLAPSATTCTLLRHGKPVISITILPLSTASGDWPSLKAAPDDKLKAVAPWTILTNGIAYLIYRSSRTAPEDVFRSFSVATTDRFAVATALGLFSSKSISSGATESVWKKEYSTARLHDFLKSCSGENAVGLGGYIFRTVRGIGDKEASLPDIISALKTISISIGEEEAAPSPVNVRIKPVSAATETRESSKVGRRRFNVSLKQLIDEEYVVPPLKIVGVYKGHKFDAVISGDGTIFFHGKQYDFLSNATSEIIKMISAEEGIPVASFLNGWAFWRFTDRATGKTLFLDDVRKKYLTDHPSGSAKGATAVKNVGSPAVPEIKHYIFTPRASDKKEDIETIKEIIDSGTLILPPKHPLRTLGKGDQLCFFARGQGVVAHAVVNSSPVVRKTRITLKLSDTAFYPKKPVVLSPALRAKMDAYKGKKEPNRWGWIALYPYKLTPRDFKLITRNT